MSTIYLQKFSREIVQYISSANYAAIASELLPIVRPKVRVVLDQAEEGRLPSYLDHLLVAPWNVVFQYNLKARARLDNNQIEDAFVCQEKSLVEYLRYLSSEKAKRDQLPILYTLIKDFKLLAVLLDKQTASSTTKGGSLENSASLITRAFSACVNDRQPRAVSLAWGVYGVANELLSAYLKMKSLHLFKSIIRSLGSAELPPLEDYPMSQQIAFKYYMGRYEFFNEDFSQAKSYLKAAFKLCPARYNSQRRQILTYLIPVMIQSGSLPKPKLLEEFQSLSAIYQPIVRSIQLGHLKALDEAIDSSERFFLDNGVYLIMEKTKDLAARELIRNTFLIIGSEPSKPWLKMDYIHSAFKISSGQNTDYSEVECRVAVLIFKKLIKGYISHEKRMLVLSKADPFPVLTGLYSLSN